MSRFEISMTEAAKRAAEGIKEEGKVLRFTVSRSGCCSMSVSIYPDNERVTDKAFDVDGYTIVTRDEYPELSWNGTIDYKQKGLNKGFVWK